MSKLKSLLKEKTYSELTELERAFVLQNITAEDYETEHQMVVMTEKLKLSQAHLTPPKATKTALMAKMQAKTPQKWVVPLPYRMAASFLLCLSIFYFSQKKYKENLIVENKINTNEIKNELIINSQKTAIIDSSNVLITEIKTIKKKTKKQSNKPVLLSDEDAEEKALLLSFSRKNPNLEWQEEDDDDTNLHKSILKCTPN